MLGISKLMIIIRVFWVETTEKFAINVVRMPKVDMNLIKQKTVQKQPKATPPTKVAMSRDTLIQPRSTSASAIAEICIRLAWLHQRHGTAISVRAHARTEHIAVHGLMQ
jgi:hypothetical protein